MSVSCGSGSPAPSDRVASNSVPARAVGSGVVEAVYVRRRGVLAAISYPVGWVAGELTAQAITVELALLAWWGWPVGWIDPVVVVTGNLALFAASWRARGVVAAAMRDAPDRPLVVASPPRAA